MERRKQVFIVSFCAVLFVLTMMLWIYLGESNYQKAHWLSYVEPSTSYSSTSKSSSPDDLATQLSRWFPDIPSKKVASFRAFSTETGGMAGEIIYASGETLSIYTNPDEVYSNHKGTFVSELQRNGVAVQIKESNDGIFATWVQDGVGWCWTPAPGDTNKDNLQETAGKLVFSIKHRSKYPDALYLPT